MDYIIAFAVIFMLVIIFTALLGNGFNFRRIPNNGIKIHIVVAIKNKRNNCPCPNKTVIP